jgi:hypothetical protein
MKTKIGRVVSALAVCATVATIALTGVSTGGGVAGAAVADCKPTWTTGPLVLNDGDLWKYTYEITWCVVGTDVRVESKTTHEEFSPRCAWAGDMTETVEPQEGGESWEVFAMGEFSCLNEDRTKAQGVNPWLVVVIHSDGTFELVDKGIAKRTVSG